MNPEFVKYIFELNEVLRQENKRLRIYSENLRKQIKNQHKTIICHQTIIELLKQEQKSPRYRLYAIKMDKARKQADKNFLDWARIRKILYEVRYRIVDRQNVQIILGLIDKEAPEIKNSMEGL